MNRYQCLWMQSLFIWFVISDVDEETSAAAGLDVSCEIFVLDV